MRPDLLAEMHLVREMLQSSSTRARCGKLLKSDHEIQSELAAVMGPDFCYDVAPDPGRIVYDKFASTVRGTAACRSANK